MAELIGYSPPPVEKIDPLSLERAGIEECFRKVKSSKSPGLMV